jgi:hypothetical protein
MEAGSKSVSTMQDSIRRQVPAAEKQVMAGKGTMNVPFNCFLGGRDRVNGSVVVKATSTRFSHQFFVGRKLWRRKRPKRKIRR